MSGVVESFSARAVHETHRDREVDEEHDDKVGRVGLSAGVPDLARDYGVVPQFDGLAVRPLYGRLTPARSAG